MLCCIAPLGEGQLYFDGIFDSITGPNDTKASKELVFV